jgi:hypothetical protein
MACHLLQFGPTNARIFINVTISQHTSSYKCRASLVHHQGAQNGIKQLLTIEPRHMYKLVCCNIAPLIKLYAFVGSNCNNGIAMHGTENVKNGLSH